MAFETLHYMQNRSTDFLKCMTLKLDMNKAYNRDDIIAKGSIMYVFVYLKC